MSPLFGAGVEADLRNSTVNILYVVQGGLGLPEKDYYLRDDERSVQLRRQYVEHVGNMLALAGAAPEAARAQAERVMAMETRLARASLGAVELRNPANFYNPTTPAEADAVTPRFSWTRYLQGIGVQAERFSFPHRAFFAELDRMLGDVPMDDWKAYLRWNLVRSASGYLSPEFERESFRFYGTVLQGTPQMQPRWKRARGSVDALVGEALGQLYVAEAFPPEAKARALAMIDNIRAGLAERLRTLEWMGPETRERALAKLATFDPKIGYPDRWRDYSALEIERGDYFGNVRRAAAFEARRQFASVGQPVDRNEWGMTPQTVNAYYNPLRNEIVFPAGIMQPPFFDPSADDAVNYGAMGAIIGHEIMHGFDDQGSQFDAQGNFGDWWTAEDKAEFTRRSQALVDQYGGVRGGGQPARERTAHAGREHRRPGRADRGVRRAAAGAGQRPRARRSTGSRRSSASSWRSHRRGAASRATRPCACRCRRTRTRPAASARWGPCRTCRSSRAPSAAGPATRWCASPPCASGKEKRRLRVPPQSVEASRGDTAGTEKASLHVLRCFRVRSELASVRSSGSAQLGTAVGRGSVARSRGSGYVPGL